MKSKTLKELESELRKVPDLSLAQFLLAVLEEINRRGATLKTFVLDLTEKG